MTAASLPGCFDFAGWVEKSEGVFFPKIVRPFYRVGGRTHSCGFQTDGLTGTAEEWAGAILAVKFDLSSFDGASCSYARYSSFGDLFEAESDFRHFVLPLYQFGPDGKTIAVDLRTAPNVQMTDV